MEQRAYHPVISTVARRCAGNAPLASLADGPMADRFHAWRGASDRRYITSVYAVDPANVDAGLPDFDTFVVLPVRIEGRARRPLSIVAIERASDRRFAIAEALAMGADEWHVHLLAADRRDRAAMVADLAARHGRVGMEALSA